jgi:hypothetical protein
MDSSAPEWCQLMLVFSKCDLGEGSDEEADIMKKLEYLKHEAVTIKCSALSG